MKVLKNIIDEFPVNVEKYQAVVSPETKNIFKLDRSKPLNKNGAGFFHTTVDGGFFLCKRDRLDIHPTIVVLCTRVKHTNKVY